MNTTYEYVLIFFIGMLTGILAVWCFWHVIDWLDRLERERDFKELDDEYRELDL